MQWYDLPRKDLIHPNKKKHTDSLDVLCSNFGLSIFKISATATIHWRMFICGAHSIETFNLKHLSRHSAPAATDNIYSLYQNCSQSFHYPLHRVVYVLCDSHFEHFYSLDWHETLSDKSSVQMINKKFRKYLFLKSKVLRGRS